MSLIAELKRRRVFKVGAAYIVVAWLAVQAASIGFPAFDAPPWAMRIFILVAALGFPVTIVLAWVFDLTPDGVRLETAPVGNKRILAIAAACAALAVGWYLAGRPAAHKDESDPRSIAVLPFVNMSADPAQEFFSDGISEELLNQLAQYPELSVAARTSAFQFKGKNLDVAEIGRKLNVAHVLEGSVRKDGARLRITAQLIKSATGFHLWSQTFERDASDVFKVQDEISSAIATALEAKLSGRPAAAATPKSADPTAYDDYLMARSLVARRVDDSLPRAIELFDRAIARAPSYSLAHSGRAFALLLAPGWNGTVTMESAFPKALAAADEALRLDPGNAEAYMVRGSVRSQQREEKLARADLDRALALAPGNVDILNFVGDDYEFTGNLRGAEKMKRQSMALDPLAFVHPTNLANILGAQGRFREAVAAGEHGLALGGGIYAQRELFFAHLRLGEFDAARRAVDAICGKQGEAISMCLHVRAAVAAAEGDRSRFDAAMAELTARHAAGSDLQDVQQPNIVALYATEVKDIARATGALRQSLGERDYYITAVLLFGPQGARLPEEISQDPDWLASWNDPRIAELMSAYRANLAAFRKGN